MSKMHSKEASPHVMRFGVKVPPFVEHKKNKLSKCFFAREGAVVAQYEDTSALRLYRLTTANEFVETKLFSNLPPSSLMVVQWPFVATIHSSSGDKGDELLRIFDLGQDSFPQMTQAIPRTQDEITGLFVDQERVFLVKRDAIFHFYGFDFSSIFGGDTKCFAVPMQPRLPFRPQHEQSMQRGRRALLIGGTKLVLVDLMSGREIVPTRALDMPVRDVDFNDDLVVATTHTSLYLVPCAGGEGARVSVPTPSTCVQLVAQQRLLMGHVDGTVALWSLGTEPRRVRLFGTPHVQTPGLSSLESIMAFAVRRLLALPDEATFVACTGTHDATAYSLTLGNSGNAIGNSSNSNSSNNSSNNSNNSANGGSDEGRALESISLKEPFMNIALFGNAVHFLGTSSLSVWRVANVLPLGSIGGAGGAGGLGGGGPVGTGGGGGGGGGAPEHSSGSGSGDTLAASEGSALSNVQATPKRRGSSLALVFKRSNRDKEKHKEKERDKERQKESARMANANGAKDSKDKSDRTMERGRDAWAVTQGGGGGGVSLADSSGDTRNTSSDKSSVDLDAPEDDMEKEDERDELDEEDLGASASVSASDEDEDEDEERKGRRHTPPSASSSPSNRRRLSAVVPGSHRTRHHSSTTSASSSPEKVRVGVSSSSPLAVRRRRSRETPSPSASAEASGSGGSSPSTASSLVRAASTSVSANPTTTTLAVAARSSRRGNNSNTSPTKAQRTPSASAPGAKVAVEASTSSSDDLERQLQLAQSTIRRHEDTITRLRLRLARYESALREAGRSADDLDEDEDTESTTATTMTASIKS